MTYRYLRKKKWEIGLILVTFIFVYIWTDAFGAASIPVESYDILKRENVCLSCTEFEADIDATTDSKAEVDIIHHLKLHQVAQNVNDSNYGISNTDFCKRPNFDLKHDSVKYAFFPMKKLNCSKEELFYIQDGVFKLNSTKLGSRRLQKCMYFGIDRLNDFYSQYTEPLTVNKPPYDIILKHDFIRIKCFVKTDEYEEEEEEEEINVTHMNEEELKSNDVVKASNERPRYFNSTQNNHPTFHANSSQHLNHTANSFNHNQNNVSKPLVFNNRSLTKAYTKSQNNEGVTLLNAQRDGSTNAGEVDNKVKTTDAGTTDNVSNRVHDFNGANNDNDDDAEENSQYRHNEEYQNYDPFRDDRYGYGEVADFDQLLVQVHPKSEVFQRIASKGRKTDIHKRPNILMLGLDSMSHLAYQRKLPKTYKYLKEKLGSVVLNGYNIVGDATVAALVPILTGKSQYVT